jgi:peptidoglycan/LPS O-acetylase OafA/YrhL
LFAVFLLIGISSYYIFVDEDWRGQMFTPVCFDAFAIGGFLSYLCIYRQDLIPAIQLRYRWIILVVVGLFVGAIYGYRFLPERTIHGLLAAAMIHYCLFKHNVRIVNMILDNKWMIWLGKISYGAYLYHAIIPELWGYIDKKFASGDIDMLWTHAMPEHLRPYWVFTQQFAFLLLICILSWKVIEQPLNALKRHFENRPVYQNEIAKADVQTVGN